MRSAPTVPFLDALVPQMAEQLPDVLQFFSTFTPDPEQVTEVPKFLPDDSSFSGSAGTGEEVFKVFSQARVPQLPHRFECMALQMREFKVFFSVFPGLKKCGGTPPNECESARQSQLSSHQMAPAGESDETGRMRLAMPCPLRMRLYGG